MESRITAVGIDEPFQFGCSPEVPCFNACCRDLVQFLTPYDILRLKNNLGMPSKDFLDRYTQSHLGPETGLPIITLRPRDRSRKRCPFVSLQGCTVYPDRPSSCRTYPVIRAIARHPETRRITEHFALLREPHCQGFHQKSTQTVRKWIKDEEIALYNRFNDPMLEIIALKKKLPGALDFKDQSTFRTALYDLDGFRRHLLNDESPGKSPLADVSLSQIESDDVALLQLAYEWVKQTLFAR